MDFEEFFKKKRIDLGALQMGEPALFSEFKTHYAQMGEKSFDHTKKYWFNTLRRKYYLAPELKPEKVKIDNPLAEQTITESLIENTAPAPKLGFTPKFRAASPPKTAAAPSEEKPDEKIDKPTSASDEAPKPAYKPRFNMKNLPKKEE
jgi:hypothetical protein